MSSAVAAISNEQRTDEWAAALKVGDVVDVLGVRGHQWRVGTITAADAQRLTVRYLYWSDESTTQIARTSLDLQPYFSRTRGLYTGTPSMLKAVAMSACQPTLKPVPLHPHSLQRFRFDTHGWFCDHCKKVHEADSAVSYSCLACTFDLCVDCYLAAGGIDTHPLPCEPPAKRVKFDSFSKLELVAEAKDFECAVCMSPAFRPANMHCGHLFCLACLDRVHPKRCPTCRAPFNDDSLQSSPFVARLISKLAVRCVNREKGCAWQGEIGPDEKTLSGHLLKECKHQVFKCPRCNEEILPDDAKQHADDACKVPTDPKKAKANRKRKRQEEEAATTAATAAAAAAAPPADSAE